MKKNLKVLLADGFEKELFESELDGLSVTCEYISDFNSTWHSHLKDIKDVHVLVVRTNTRVDRELVDHMPNLEVVISATHGRDHINLEYLKERGIEFYDVPAQSTDVAQGVIAYVLEHATNLVKGYEGMKRGEWLKNELIGTRIEEETIGIIGFGRIGKKVAEKAYALGMKILAHDPDVEGKEDVNYVKFVSLEELLRESDYVTLHVPLNETTKHLIGRDQFKTMKKGAYLINTARGGIVDVVALLEALESGKLSGAAIDVYEESPFENEIYKKLMDEGAILTPHSIAQTGEAYYEKNVGPARIIKRLYKTKFMN